MDKAIFDGGALSFLNLTVSVAPFVAHGTDGLVVISDAIESLTLTSGQIQYLVCFAQYQFNAAPLLQMKLVTPTDWSLNKASYFTFARFDLFTGAPHITVPLLQVSYSDSDYSDKLGKQVWRSSVATKTVLDTIITQNRVGDTRLCLDTYQCYTWNGGSWQALKVGLTDGYIKSNDIISDRVVHTGTNVVSYIYVPFTRKFTTAPSSITLSGAGGLEAAVTTAVVSAITPLGFIITVTPSATFTLDRTWTTVP
jgi:hypothetical protein